VPAPLRCEAGRASCRAACGVGGRFEKIVRRRAGPAADLDASRLHCLGDFALELNAQQAILEARAFDDHEVRELELTLERTRRDAPMEILARAVLLRLSAGDAQQVVLRDDLDLIGPETGDRERDAVTILALALDVERWAAPVVASPASFEQIEQPVEADGRTAKGRKIEIGPHIQILQ